MFRNIFRAEFYKQYSKKTSLILPAVIFILFILVPLIYLNTLESLLYTRNEKEVFALFNLLSVLALGMFVLGVFITFIVPLITPISIYGQDYSNNVISNTIAIGGKRVHIFLAKFIVTNFHCMIYYLSGVLGIIIATSIFLATTTEDISELLKLLTEIEVDWGTIMHWFSNVAMALILTSSIAILAITLTKNFVGAFFASIGFHFGLYLTPMTFILYNFLQALAYNQENISIHRYFLTTNIYMFIVSLLLLMLSLLKFLKTEY